MGRDEKISTKEQKWLKREIHMKDKNYYWHYRCMQMLNGKERKDMNIRQRFPYSTMKSISAAAFSFTAFPSL